MKNFILGEFISSHDDEEINTLDSKTIMKVTNTEYETEEDFYNTYKYIYLNQNRFSQYHN